MIQSDSLQHAAHISDSVMYAGGVLQPIAGTPVANLVKTLSSFRDDGTDTTIQDQSINPGTSQGTHAEVEEYAVKQIAKVMRNVVNTAKNLVNPHCRSILKEIEEQSKITRLSAVGILGEIKQIDLPPILTDDMFQALLEPYQNVNAGIIRDTYLLLNKMQETYSDEEYRELATTGSPLLDGRISTFIDGAFGSGRDSYSVKSICSYFGNNMDIATIPIAECVVLFLVLTGVQNNKIESASAITESSQLNAILAQLRSALAGRVYRDVLLYEEAIKNGDLIARSDFLFDDKRSGVDTSRTLLVYGKNYRDWIQNKGGSPEAALGYLSRNGGLYSLAGNSDLTLNPDIYKEVYTQKIKQAQSKTIISDISLARQITGKYLSDVIRRMEDANRPELQSRLKAALEHEYNGAVTLIPYVIKVVSRTLTDGNDVKDLLLLIDSILASQAEPNMDYAVYMASITLVGRWLKDQLAIVPDVK